MTTTHVMTPAERKSLQAAARDLHARFRGTFGEESIHALLLDSYQELAATATVTRWLAVGAERFTRQRLEAIAHARDCAPGTVVTMGCGDVCPLVPGRQYEDWEPDDPEGKTLEQVRVIRDQIRDRVTGLLARLGIPA